MISMANNHDYSQMNLMLTRQKKMLFLQTKILMMKQIFCSFYFLLILLACQAESVDGIKSSDTLKLPDERYSISLTGFYGWNNTWLSHGGVDVNAHLPVNPHFELDVATEYNSASIWAFTVVTRPKFPLRVGELFLDWGFHNRLFFADYQTAWLSLTGSFGYRMDYVSVQFGIVSNFICDMKRDWKTEDENIYEPFNLLYKIAVNVRPFTSCWNIQLSMANYTDYEYERTWLPIFSVRGNYNFLNHFSAMLDVYFKSAGRFHLNNHFSGILVRAGIKYMF